MLSLDTDTHSAVESSLKLFTWLENFTPNILEAECDA
jgi:hypothetical protein